MALAPDELSEKIAILEDIPLFAGLSREALSTLVGDIRARRYAAGEMIFMEGELSRTIYIVRKGKVRIYKTNPAGDETSTNILTNGAVIGEFAAVDRLPRSAAAVALEDCLMLFMSADTFLTRLRQMPDLALNLAQLLTAKARWTTQYAETIAQYEAPGRLLHMLLMYNEQMGEELEPGKRYRLKLGLNQRGLASMVGVRRERVTHLLKEWREKGLLEYRRGGTITILDLHRMKQERNRHTDIIDEEIIW